MNNTTGTTLVIDSRKLQQLAIDGPALKVVMQGKSPVLFPLRRLSRIHILGASAVAVDALLHCAEQDIPTAFFHANGRLRCRLASATKTPGRVDHWFEHIDFDDNIRQLYQDWLHHQQAYVMSQLVIGGCGGRSRQLLDEALQGYFRQQLGKQGKTSALEWLDGLLTCHIEQQVTAGGFVSPHSQNRLVQDIKPICNIVLHYALAVHLQQQSGFVVSAQSVTAFYQQHAETVENNVRRMLMQLVNRLEAVV